MTKNDRDASIAGAGFTILGRPLEGGLMNRDVDRWLSAARTTGTRARIRRWARLRSASFVLMIACTGGAIVAGDWGAVVSFFGMEVAWWVPLLAVGVVLAALLLWCVTSFMLDAARYADGDEVVGTISEVRVDDSMGPDSNPSYDMLITAELAGGRRLLRAARESPREAPRIGQRVRFLHNTQDPDDLQDILLLEVIAESVQGTEGVN